MDRLRPHAERVNVTMDDETSTDGQGDLTERQKAFVREYLVDMNATAAYKRAGYRATGNAAEVNASRLLRNAQVQTAIREGIAKHADAAGLTVERIWDEWRRIALADIGDIIDFSGEQPKLRPANKITEDARRAIASVKVKRSVEGKGDDAQKIEIMEFKLWDKPGVLRDAAKARELFKEKVEVSWPGGKPVEVIEIVRPAPKALPPSEIVNGGSDGESL